MSRIMVFTDKPTKHEATIWYGPKCVHHKTFESAKAFALDMANEFHKGGWTGIKVLHYENDRKDCKPIDLTPNL